MCTILNTVYTNYVHVGRLVNVSINAIIYTVVIVYTIEIYDVQAILPHSIFTNKILSIVCMLLKFYCTSRM